ncbi:hypothetical protein [Corallococcus macrosporus]|uniref:Glycosyltransferase n=2 Tax=Myxococcaceae TaxID=31 RepID=A0A286NVN1_9BACT|nr:hypothetical protein [Corallococcus macrosporus]AEI64004.1 hypothetical protein LILAB_10465 [Corallococcus macrosporus]ATB51226.1 hypothetical protein MYMAC_006884 [Corallococcus macrosporus DSM 14697]
MAGRWLVYALGGGMGHLTRASALARAASRRGHAVVLLTNSPFAAGLPLEAVLGAGVEVLRLSPALGREAVGEVVARCLEDVRPDVFLVDTFPRGLGGELAPLLSSVRARKVLIHRDVNPTYVKQYGLARAVEAFDLLLVPGEDAPFARHARAVRTAPWLLLRASELLPRDKARARLGVSAEDDRALVAVMGCGTPTEVEEAGHIAARLDARLAGGAVVRWLVPPGPGRDGGPRQATPEGWAPRVPVWPALAVLPGVDVLVGAGGYNTVQEARATGTPFLALARPRLYDRQSLRLRAEERAGTVEALVTRAARLALARPARGLGPYVSGTDDAVTLIEDTVLSA